MPKLEVDLEEAKEIFQVLEELNEFFHQPMNYETKDQVEVFAHKIYPKISNSYYKTVWGWLPESTRKEIEER